LGGRMAFSTRFPLGLVVAVAGAILSGCGITPVSGPQSWDIAKGTDTELPYGLVKLRLDTVNVLATSEPRLVGRFNDRRGPQTVVIGVGDIVGVTIFDTGAGLFVPGDTGIRPSNVITVPPQAVGIDGNITVPSAGIISAKGKTVAQVQQSIVAALKNRALEPNVVVTILDQRASAYTILGDVRASGRFPVFQSGERLLDAIGRAGGLLGQGNESWVVLERQGKRALVPFGALVDEPANNIYVRPLDTIYVYREPQTFLALGAAGRQGQFAFDAWRVSLSEAIAKATGLSDVQANPAAVFVYRGETREVARELGIDVAAYDGPLIPVIYQLDLHDPGGYFLASKFQMRNKDVIYVSNAASVEGTKLLTYISQIVRTAQDPVNLGISGYALKAAIEGKGVGAAIVTGIGGN
jgi:polysaccharide export outer membrane protein